MWNKFQLGLGLLGTEGLNSHSLEQSNRSTWTNITRWGIGYKSPINVASSVGKNVGKFVNLGPKSTCRPISLYIILYLQGCSQDIRCQYFSTFWIIWFDVHSSLPMQLT